jgi:hypothetical protein
MSWRAWLARLDEPRDLKRTVYRAHRIAGLFLFAGALFTLDGLVFRSHPGVLARIFDGGADAVIEAVVAEALHLFLLIGNAFALAVGAVVVFRPSLLKGLERWADRTYGK